MYLVYVIYSHDFIYEDEIKILKVAKSPESAQAYLLSLLAEPDIREAASQFDYNTVEAFKQDFLASPDFNEYFGFSVEETELLLD